MRGLSESYFDCLKSGFLSGITESVKGDPDLNLEIRNNYINVYYKGNSLLKLSETSTHQYKAVIDKKFLEELRFPLVFTEGNIDQFLSAIPLLKQNIVKHGKRSLELEYEQMIIRANNYEPRNNSEYFIVDRQYAVKEGQYDLTGIFWERSRRRKNQEVPVCLMEIKFALNADINIVHEQIYRYYKSIKPRAAEFATEMQFVFRQKLDLGIYKQPKERLAALKTLKFSREIEKFQFILVLVDYNPYSSKLDLSSLANLPFADQIKVFFGGFAMWQQNVTSLESLEK
ncbi:MAG: hypothetical protein ACK2U1_20245 [Anaerolineales bacterium]